MGFAVGGSTGTLGMATGMAAVRFLRCRFCPLLLLLRPEEDLPASSLELSLRESESSAERGRTDGSVEACGQFQDRHKVLRFMQCGTERNTMNGPPTVLEHTRSKEQERLDCHP